MRTLTRLVSTVLAVALLAGGLLVALEIAAAGLGREQPVVLQWDNWYRSAVGTRWTDPDWRLLFVIFTVLGALLLFLLLARRRPTGVPLSDRVPGSQADLDRSGLERWLSSRVDKVDGVASNSVRVNKNRASVKVVTPGRDTEQVRQAVGAATTQNLEQLGLSTRLPVKVAVSSQRA